MEATAFFKILIGNWVHFNFHVLMENIFIYPISNNPVRLFASNIIYNEFLLKNIYV